MGTVDITGDSTAVTATLTGTTLRADEHAVSLLLLDAATGKPVAVDYGFVTTRQTDTGGLIQSVSVPLAGVTVPASVRAYLMVDTYPAFRATLAIP